MNFCSGQGPAALLDNRSVNQTKNVFSSEPKKINVFFSLVSWLVVPGLPPFQKVYVLKVYVPFSCLICGRVNDLPQSAHLRNRDGSTWTAIAMLLFSGLCET